MSNQRFGHRRARARKAVAVSVIWAGLGTGGLVAEHASAASPVAPPASASAGASKAAHDPTGLLKAASVPVHGVADDGTELFGAFQLERFQVHGGVLYAVGDLTGTLGGSRSVTKNNVRIPVSGATEPATPTSGLLQADAVPTADACTILTLNLGKLDLNLLGLHVVLDPVSLLVEAVPGAGALVGNLLCGITNLLNGGAGLGGLLTNLLTAIANLLNGLLTV